MNMHINIKKKDNRIQVMARTFTGGGRSKEGEKGYFGCILALGHKQRR
jgi:hypothetical protein